MNKALLSISIFLIAQLSVVGQEIENKYFPLIPGKTSQFAGPNSYSNTISFNDSLDKFEMLLEKPHSDPLIIYLIMREDGIYRVNDEGKEFLFLPNTFKAGFTWKTEDGEYKIVSTHANTYTPKGAYRDLLMVKSTNTEEDLTIFTFFKEGVGKIAEVGEDLELLSYLDN